MAEENAAMKMADSDVPQSRNEKIIARAVKSYSGAVEEPESRIERLLTELCDLLQKKSGIPDWNVTEEKEDGFIRNKPKIRSGEGKASIVESMDCSAAGDNAHAEGMNTNASGEAAHAEGTDATASGDSAHAEGMETEASAEWTHAEGMGTKASAEGAHAEGAETVAEGEYSHTEGENTSAEGVGAHAEGYYSSASGDYSHAEGNGTAKADYSHAEGTTTEARNFNAHAEGEGTIAQGKNAHAEGLYTIAYGKESHVFGRYNCRPKYKVDDRYVEIVGNGTMNQYSDARRLDWEGNEFVAGKITVGAGPTESMDLTTKKYVDSLVADLQEKIDAVTSAAGSEKS